MTEAQLAEWERLAAAQSPYPFWEAQDAITALVAEVRRLRQAEHDLRADCQRKLSAAHVEAALVRRAAVAARAYLDALGTTDAGAARARLREAMESAEGGKP